MFARTGVMLHLYYIVFINEVIDRIVTCTFHIHGVGDLFQPTSASGSSASSSSMSLSDPSSVSVTSSISPISSDVIDEDTFHVLQQDLQVQSTLSIFLTNLIARITATYTLIGGFTRRVFYLFN